jgi:hypothetical protein
MGIIGSMAFWRRKPATIEVIRGVDGKVKMLLTDGISQQKLAELKALIPTLDRKTRTIDLRAN